MIQGINKIDSIILNQKASIIQRCWDNYWYQPNEQGISRHAVQGIQNINDNEGIHLIYTIDNASEMINF